jgi:hypothetical protein
MPVLGALSDPEPAAWPTLTVLIPACNEAAALPVTLKALLAVDYPALEIVVVDDRSTDTTPEVLARLSAEDPRIRSVRIDALPPGWLGKVHALHRGMEAVRTDWVLFMDADVELAPGALRRAVAHGEARGLALLSAHPEIRSGGLLVDAVFNSTALSLAGARYWDVANPRKKTALSVGAFILVRTAPFRATDGFEWLKMEVADDMALSLLMKRAGHPIALLNGRGQVVLTWYQGFREMQAKMQKNWFSIMARCSLPRAFVLAVFIALFPLLPLSQVLELGVPLPLRMLLLALGLGGFSATTLVWARGTARPVLTALVPQLGALLMAWMLVRSAIIGARLGGIEWRGQLYKASDINAGRRVFL